jgi:hypothetical protein
LLQHNVGPINTFTRFKVFNFVVIQASGRKTTTPGVDVMIIIFGDFCQFSAKKLAFFSKTNVMINFFLQKLAVV